MWRRLLTSLSLPMQPFLLHEPHRRIRRIFLRLIRRLRNGGTLRSGGLNWRFRSNIRRLRSLLLFLRRLIGIVLELLQVCVRYGVRILKNLMGKGYPYSSTWSHTFFVRIFLRLSASMKLSSVSATVARAFFSSSTTSSSSLLSCNLA